MAEGKSRHLEIVIDGDDAKITVDGQAIEGVTEYTVTQRANQPPEVTLKLWAFNAKLGGMVPEIKQDLGTRHRGA